jgi:polyhydroxyalkanoate synthesis regulator protein
MKVLIRREGDGRLYNMESITHLSLSDVANILVGGLRIIVEDATTGEDVTSDILDSLLEREARHRFESRNQTQIS